MVRACRCVGAIGLVASAACGDQAARTPAPPKTYAGVTTCGAPVPAAEPRRDIVLEPQVEPMLGRPVVAPPAPTSAPGPWPDLDVVDAQIRAHRVGIRQCIGAFFELHPRADWFRVATHVAIAADGKVIGVEVRGIDAALDRCMCDRLIAIDFRGIGARADVRYPFVMSR